MSNLIKNFKVITVVCFLAGLGASLEAARPTAPNSRGAVGQGVGVGQKGVGVGGLAGVGESVGIGENEGVGDVKGAGQEGVGMGGQEGVGDQKQLGCFKKHIYVTSSFKT